MPIFTATSAAAKGRIRIGSIPTPFPPTRQSTQRMQHILFLFVLVTPLCLFSCSCHALQQPKPTPTSSSSTTPNDFFSKLKDNFPSKTSPPPPPSFLETLNLESSTEPKKFSFLPRQIWDLATASFPLVMRLGSGVFAEGYQVSLVAKDTSRYTILSVGQSQIREYSDLTFSKQNQPLVLYEFEGCPFCRKVREAVSILSLEVTFKPCPQDGAFRNEIKSQFGNQATFPYLVDPNTGVQMFESDDIINYLFRVYGSPKRINNKNNSKLNPVPWTLTPSSPWVTLSSGLGMLPRINRGGRYRSSNPPEIPLVFWSYEGSPFCKIVRERLVELGIPHTQISCPRGSYNRERLFRETGGRFQVPYLQDPTTGVDLFESAAIIEYLEKVYGVPEPKVKYL